jgi:hypothetical protein
MEDNSMNLLELAGKKTYIYGTGKFASRIKGVLQKENIEVLAFLELNKIFHHLNKCRKFL